MTERLVVDRIRGISFGRGVPGLDRHADRAPSERSAGFRFQALGAALTGVDRGALAVAAIVAALGVFLLVAARDVTTAGEALDAGRAVFPTLIGTGLVVLGAALTFLALARPPSAPDDETSELHADASRMDWRAQVLLGSGIIAYIALIRPLGVAVAGGALFGLAALAFRSHHPVRDTTIGVLIAVLAYIVFTAGLGFNVPAEPITLAVEH
jgi:putative tricarboxylic transport membrane protein